MHNMSKALKKLLRGDERAFLEFLESQTQLNYAEVAEKAAWLTPREWAVLNEMAMGVKNREIATRLGISSKTLDIHRANIGKKLGVNSANQYGRVAWLLKLANELYPDILIQAQEKRKAE